ncbi:MAG: hypothetical protein KY467_11110 [Gemmatimonadetes bacterium]|nr:hypothetical protein [Gemmatimonadota bacterium]
MHRWIPAVALIAALPLAACGAGADDEQATASGGTQAVEATPASDGRSVSGSESAQEHGTAANDTTPYRPGTP